LVLLAGLSQEAPVTTGSAPGLYEALLVTGPALTLFWPGVGTIVVTTRRLITFRTCTTGAAGVVCSLAKL
jgi:hypothetical protein